MSSYEILKVLGLKIIYCRRQTCLEDGATLSRHRYSAASQNFVLLLGFWNLQFCVVSRFLKPALFQVFVKHLDCQPRIIAPENPTSSVQNFGHQHVMCSTNSPSSSDPLSEAERTLNILLHPLHSRIDIFFIAV